MTQTWNNNDPTTPLSGPRMTILQGEVDGKIAATLVDVKGDLIAATAADVVTRLGAGANGQVLSANSATATGLEWVAQTGGGGGGTSVTINNQTGTTYTLVLGDAGAVVRMSNTAANTLTIPTNASVGYPTGTFLEVRQVNTGQTAIAPAGGVTLNSDASMRKISARWRSVSLLKTATDTWELDGSLAP